ncbi:unnamed protein product [Peniophora sp. CBMAI 1063]|nr:unnamed protein product [Peniophora sp. CBMAI 1063]
MNAFGLPDEGWQPPTVPPRKGKRLRQNKQPQPYTEAEPSPHASPRPSSQDKLDRELQCPHPYTAGSESSPRLDAQGKLRRERLRELAHTSTGSRGPSHSRTESAPPSYRSASPAPTFASLPPYTPGPSRHQHRTSRESAQMKTARIFDMLGLPMPRMRIREPEWVLEAGPEPAQITRALFALPGASFDRMDTALEEQYDTVDEENIANKDSGSDINMIIGRA